MQDLLAVRRIPLRRHSYLSEVQDSGRIEPASSPEREMPDPAVKPLMRKIQEIVATDRDLHEKVEPNVSAFPYSHNTLST